MKTKTEKFTKTKLKENYLKLNLKSKLKLIF